MPTYGHYLWYAHAFLKASRNCLMAQIVKCQISNASSCTQSLLGLSYCSIRNWEDEICGLWCLINMIEC